MAAALGCMLAYCRAFATGFAGAIPMSVLPSMDVFASASSMARVVAIIVLTFLGCLYRVSINRYVLAGAGVVMAVSGLVLAGGLGVAEGVPLALLAGAGSGVAMLAVMLLLSNMRISQIVGASFGGLLVGGLLIGSLMRLDAVPATAVLVLSGLLAGVLLAFADSTGESLRADGLPHAEQVASFPWFAAIMFAVSGLLSSVFYGVAGALGWNAAGQVNYPLFGVAIVLVLGITAYIVLQGEETAAAAWIPLFALLLLAMALACFDDAEVNPSVEGLLMASVFSYHFLRWMVFPAIISVSRMPREFICGIALVATSGLFGVGWGAQTAGILPAGLRDQSGFVAVVALVLLLMFAAALLVNRARFESARMQLGTALAQLAETRAKVDELSKKLDEEPQPVQSTTEDRCASLAAENGLTAREAEILVLTARGHSSTFVAEQLFISASTVRFHQQNIYRKLNVHSRQELLALVNDKEVS